MPMACIYQGTRCYHAAKWATYNYAGHLYLAEFQLYNVYGANDSSNFVQSMDSGPGAGCCACFSQTQYQRQHSILSLEIRGMKTTTTPDSPLPCHL